MNPPSKILIPKRPRATSNSYIEGENEDSKREEEEFLETLLSVVQDSEQVSIDLDLKKLYNLTLNE